MNIYTSNKNQDLLWNVISENSIVKQYFTNKNIQIKHDWFKTVISSIYNKYREQNLTSSMISTINKETISYMINNIRELSNTTSTPIANIYNSINTPDIVPDNTSNYQSSQYDNRVKEYEQMNIRPLPPDINFNDKVDSHITDMDTLLKQQLEDRDQQLKQYTPPPSLLNGSVQSLKIHEQSVIVDTHELSTRLDNKKHVKWEDNNDEIISEMRDQIGELLKEINIIKDKLSIP
jgi:hypothetical protein